MRTADPARQVSASSAAAFRIVFGLAGLILVVRHFAHGWVDQLYISPEFHFTYPGFAWVQPWPGSGMYVHFAVMGAAAVAVALGWRYRWSVAVFTLSLAYVELIDRALYLNHYYWMVLTGAVIAFLPLNRMYSLDGRAGRVSPGPIPIGVVWLLRFQVGMVYVFAGIAKLNPDWLFDAQPLATWLPARSDLAVIGPLLSLGGTPFALAWAAAIFDLTIVGWLLWRRSRIYAYGAVIIFHTLTWALFPRIGMFPLLMTTGALIFFPPTWPEQLKLFIQRRSRTGGVPERSEGEDGTIPTPKTKLSLQRTLAIVYVVLMIVLPLRHFAIPGDVQETGEGYLASWHVMLTERVGAIEFRVHDPETEATWVVPPPDYLTDQQLMVMATDPVMTRQVADEIAALYGEVEVTTETRLTVNGRSGAVGTSGGGGNTQ